MRISVVIQYYNRRSHLINTIRSIRNTDLDYSEFEIIIIDDASSEEHRIEDICDLFPDLQINLYSFDKEDKWWYCPVLVINKGIAMAKGDIIMIIGAECMLVGDVISDALRISQGEYFVYSTYALSEQYTNSIENIPYELIKANPFADSEGGFWYQHSEHNTNCYNFCVAIRKEDMDKLGGFDERYAVGYHSGDVDFIKRARKILDIKMIDFPLAYHQHHEPMQFNEFMNGYEKKSNMGGAALTRYIADNEPDKIKVKNSFEENPGLIPPKPELTEIEREIDITLLVGREGSCNHIEFQSEYTALCTEITISNKETGESYKTKLQSGSYLPIYCEHRSIEFTLNGEHIYSGYLEEGFDCRIELKINSKILTHF